jgi:predicted RND superfamily exporter protein
MLKFSLWDLFTHGFLRPLVCATIQITILLVFRRYVDSLATLGLLCLASLVTFGMLALFVAITQEERSALFRMRFLKTKAS